MNALSRAVVKVGEASGVRHIKPIAEACYSKQFSYHLDNQRQLVAHVLYRTGGPPSLTTRSHVATLDFLRCHFGSVRIPQVLYWDDDANSEVGCEYIIMEGYGGSEIRPPFGSEVSDFVQDLVQFEAQLADIKFSSFGSIFYKEDVPLALQERPLYRDRRLTDVCTERFRIGPSIARDFYRAERALLDIDRSPWLDVESYLEAVMDCELEWIRTYADDSPYAKKFFSLWSPSHDYGKRFEQCRQLLPQILPEDDLCMPTLSRPSFSESDIFAPHESDPLGVIADWQGTTIKPLFLTSPANLPTFRAGWGPSSDGLPADIPALPLIRSLHHDSPIRHLDKAHVKGLQDLVYSLTKCWCVGLAVLEANLDRLPKRYGDHWPKEVPHPTADWSEEELNNMIVMTAVAYDMKYSVQNKLSKAGIQNGEGGMIAREDFQEAINIIAEVFCGMMTGERGLDFILSCDVLWLWGAESPTATMEPCDLGEKK